MVITVILGGAFILGGLKLKSISMHIFVAYFASLAESLIRVHKQEAEKHPPLTADGDAQVLKQEAEKHPLLHGAEKLWYMAPRDIFHRNHHMVIAVILGVAFCHFGWSGHFGWTKTEKH
jgi:hypothetical protein